MSADEKDPIDEIPDNRFNRVLQAGGSIRDAIIAVKGGGDPDGDVDWNIEVAAYKLYRYDNPRARDLPAGFREAYLEKARLMADHFAHYELPQVAVTK